jgi:hypothetical protein
MKKTLTRAVFVIAFAVSTVFAVQGSLGSKGSTFQSLCSGPGCAARDSVMENLDKGDSNAKHDLDKGSPDSAKDNLDKGGADTKDNLDKGPCAKDNLDKNGADAKDNLGVGLL